MNIFENLNNGFSVRYGIKESLSESDAVDVGEDLARYQRYVDYDMKHYGKISDRTMRIIERNGLSVVKDQYGDYEVIAHSADEDDHSDEALKERKSPCKKLTEADEDADSNYVIKAYYKGKEVDGGYIVEDSDSDYGWSLLKVFYTEDNEDLDSYDPYDDADAKGYDDIAEVVHWWISPQSDMKNLTKLIQMDMSWREGAYQPYYDALDLLREELDFKFGKLQESYRDSSIKARSVAKKADKFCKVNESLKYRTRYGSAKRKHMNEDRSTPLITIAERTLREEFGLRPTKTTKLQDLYEVHYSFKKTDAKLSDGSYDKEKYDELVRKLKKTLDDLMNTGIIYGYKIPSVPTDYAEMIVTVPDALLA